MAEFDPSLHPTKRANLLESQPFQQAHDVLLENGETLIREGQPSPFLYCVVEGELTIWKATESDPLELAKLRRGEICGEMSILDGGGASATVTASAPTRLRAITADACHQAIQSDPFFAQQLSLVLIARLRAADRRLAQLPDRRRRSSDPGARPAVDLSPDRAAANPPASPPAAAQASATAGAASSADDVPPVVVSIEGLTGPAQAALPANPYVIPRLPCRIGRGGSDSEAYNDIVIKDLEPFQIAKNHLLIFQERRGGAMQGRIGIFDRGSERGSWIDDRPLGGLMGDDSATFLEADNAVIVLGDQDSVFRFQLRVASA